MLSPMIAAIAASDDDRDDVEVPACEARSAAVMSAVSPGTGTPDDSNMTSRTER